MACVYGVLRHYFSLSESLAQQIKKPLRKKDADIHCLLLSGLYQLRDMNVPPHAAVNESVAACKALKKPWSRGLVNAVLRSRNSEADPPRAEQSRYEHPQWLVDLIRRDQPEHWSEILSANNQQPPLTLRINQRLTDRDAYRALLSEHGFESARTDFSNVGILLKQAQRTENLPGFDDGLVSVQDEAAQLASVLLDVQSGQRVLDACAAPGGKTAHLLEHCGENSKVVALDISEQRLFRLRAGLQRLGLEAEVICGSAVTPGEWWDGRRFDRILVDAPCSATGVIRRHPDIRFHRSPEQLPELNERQCQIIEGLWPLLADGGTLLYVTCSVLVSENDATIEQVLKTTPDMQVEPLDLNWGHPTRFGRQVLPGEHDMDGFYYCRLVKRDSSRK